MGQIIAVKELLKQYGDKKAVDRFSFEVEKGEVFGLLGPNGAGKTTTLECIEGMRKFDSGTITVAGVDVSKNENKIRKLLGVQLQSSSLQDDIRAGEVMSLICGWHHTPVRLDLLKRLGLEKEIGKQYGKLSTGQKRRLHLALALAANPEVVVLDEPTAGLDVEGRTELHQIIRGLKAEGITFLLATHDMAEAEILCDRIAIIINGRLATIGTPAQVTAAGNMDTKITIQAARNSLLPGRDTKFARFLSGSDGYGVWMAQNVSKAVMELLSQVESQNDEVRDLRVERPSLEERFMEIVVQEGK
jgi:ABC-2 type transport system ATP-binding protein